MTLCKPAAASPPWPAALPASPHPSKRTSSASRGQHNGGSRRSNAAARGRNAMKLQHTTSVIALLTGLGLAAPVMAAEPGNQLEELIVTAQKREDNAQTAPLAITAITGSNLAKDRVLTLEDLAHNMTGISFTANSPQSNEINIRGVVNTRLSSPTADQSVATFVDDVYVSRSGNLNSAFYDVARVEVVRGPQGVLLGINVDYAKDSNDGVHRVGLKSKTLPASFTPWSGTRALIAALRPGGLSRKESLPIWPLFKGDTAPTPQGARHETYDIIIKR